MNYILAEDGKTPVVCDVLTWADWFQEADRSVRRTVFVHGIPREEKLAAEAAHDFGAQGIVVSTVFLGIDHNFSGVGPPVLWESMVFDEAGSMDDEIQERYASHDEAVAGHEALVEQVGARLAGSFPKG